MPPKRQEVYIVEVWTRPYDPEDGYADDLRNPDNTIRNVWRAFTWPRGIFVTADTKADAIREAINKFDEAQTQIATITPMTSLLFKIDWEAVAPDLIAPDSFTPDGSETSPGITWEIRLIESKL